MRTPRTPDTPLPVVPLVSVRLWAPLLLLAGNGHDSPSGAASASSDEHDRPRLLRRLGPAGAVLKWAVIVLLAYLEWSWDAAPRGDRALSASTPIAEALAAPAGGLAQ